MIDVQPHGTPYSTPRRSNRVQGTYHDHLIHLANVDSCAASHRVELASHANRSPFSVATTGFRLSRGRVHRLWGVAHRSYEPNDKGPFSTCCFKGKVHLPASPQRSDDYRELFDGLDHGELHTKSGEHGWR
ncbi:BQ2448_1539 [Microbotryum intermedium]|uniref:BQ2448_1539 protein n=1 Tax=Microbotryum intermedium TaxID=269621 RepID=A0A238FAA5_9BASI|nr:BQ2448_1539 [Microbotryum intermedium]